MTNQTQKIEFSKSKLNILLLSVSVCFGYPTAALAQDNLVVSPERAEDIQSDIQIDLFDEDLAENLDVKSNTTINTDTANFSNEGDVPALTENRENTNFTVGVLARISDGETGDLYRDPFDVDTVEVSPIYPEGIYVDHMRTDAGVNVTSKF